MDATEVVTALEGIAPLRLAAEWDNVGLLVEGTRAVGCAGLCVDLTEPVLDELLAAGVDFVVAYHPPVFRPLSRLTRRSPAERIALAAARAGVWVYSPHTALDAARDGMTDWLLGAVGPVRGVAPAVADAVEPDLGAGRLATRVEPAPLDQVVEQVKRFLGLPVVRVAAPPGFGLVRTVAVCPGSGGSVVGRARADLVLTGELGHHEVLARVAAGGAVVLTDHSNTERGFLPVLADRLTRGLGLEVVVSRVDRDPLVAR
ncbi:MAG: Nif3-like dinuclear metal center hexameric protein [Myxococcota bacterium]